MTPFFCVTEPNATDAVEEGTVAVSRDEAWDPWRSFPKKCCNVEAAARGVEAPRPVSTPSMGPRDASAERRRAVPLARGVKGTEDSEAYISALLATTRTGSAERSLLSAAGEAEADVAALPTQE